MPSSTHHLLTLWNPSYTGDALDAHLTVLLKWAEEHAHGRADPEDAYVWWGKIRSKNRDGRLPHHAEVLALDEQVQAGAETHLYLTDYRSLYVAHVGEITDDDVRTDAGELEHMPGYYEGHPVIAHRSASCPSTHLQRRGWVRSLLTTSILLPWRFASYSDPGG
jgi:hypothetical protein